MTGSPTPSASAPAPRLLIVDDDRGLLDVLTMALEDAGYVVYTADNGRRGIERFREVGPDLVVLDLLMPELDGLEVCRQIRATHATPIIMLTSRAEEMDKVLGLEFGADDYVTKPFSTRELVARIRAALRRAQRETSGPASAEAGDSLRICGPLTLSRSRHEVQLHGTRIDLTATEFELLWTLTERPGHVCERRTIIDRVYGMHVVVADRTIDTFVKRLRRKLAEVDSAYQPIETVRALGYRFREPSP